MNLLHRRYSIFETEIESQPDDIFSVLTYKKYEYNKIPDVCESLIEHLSRITKGAIKPYKIELTRKTSYKGLDNSELLDLNIQVNFNGTITNFCKFYIPRLLDGQFFIINGTYYVPCMYILDYPLIVKKESIICQSLLHSITIYPKNKSVTFMGHNIPIFNFYKIFIDPDDPDTYKKYVDFLNVYKIKDEKTIESNLISYYSDLFKVKFNNKEEIKEYFNFLFFDDVTKRLFDNCYYDEFNGNATIEKIIYKTLDMVLNDKKPHFTDLNSKRLVLSDKLMLPFYKKLAEYIKFYINSTTKIQNKLDMQNLKIVKHFTTSKKEDGGLFGNYTYDTNNLFSALLNSKCSMMPPSSENGPKDISEIHETHYGRICPITVSNTKVGHTVSLIPTCKVDKFGCFLTHKGDENE